MLLATALPEEVAEPAADSGSVAPQPAPDALAEDEIRLTLTFSGDCWTEISDANGRRLFFGMGRNGRTVDLTGPAPFRVLVGNADSVELQLNGNPYSIPASSRSNRTARLTILQP